MRGVQIKSLIKLLFVLAAIVWPISASAQIIQLLGVTSSVWSYKSNKSDNPPAFVPGDAWAAPAFDDSGWPTGTGLFGVDFTGAAQYLPWTFNTYITNPRSDNGATAGVAGSGPLSSYFRTHFTWSGPTAGVALHFTNYVDDGIIVYLNGQELFSFNVPATRPVPWDILTMPNNANPLGEGVPIITNIVDSPLLVAGDNVLAVGLHQHLNTSSDDVFGMSLTGIIPFAPTNQNVLEPTNRTILQNRSSILQVFSSSSPAPTYQWYVGGEAITDATNSTLLVTNEMAGTSTSNFFVIVTNPLGSFQSRTAAITFTSDTVPPAVVRAIPNATFTEIRVEFNEAVEPMTAQDGFNYMVSGGISLLGDPVLTLSGRTVLLTLASALSPDTVYTVTVDNVTDLAGLPVPASSAVQFRSWLPTSVGGWVFEAFNGTPSANVVGTIGGTAVANLTSHPSYPDSPSEVLLMPATTTRALGVGYEGDGHDNYGAHIRGLFFPPESGNWIFYLSPDDGGQLFLNPTGPDAAGKVLIAQQGGCCNLFNAPGPWNSAPIPLVGGQPYYIEGLYKEGIGGDYFHLATALEGAPIPAGGGQGGCASCNDPSVVGSGAMPAGVAGTFTITQQPTNYPGIAAMPATFRVGVNQSLGLPVLYQWLRNGAPIAGANLASYSFIPSLADNNAMYSVAITNLGGFGMISDSATLTVVPDTFRPTVVSATPSLDGSNIVILYSEGMASDTAETFYYQVDDDGVASATLSADARSVTVVFHAPLTTPCAAHVFQITDVRDIAGNQLDPNPTLIPFTLPLLAVPIDANHLWRWDSSGTDLTGTGWENPGYDDSAWPSGPGVLAFEPDNNTPAAFPIRTNITDYVSSKLTIYFRTHFNLATDPDAVTNLQLSLIIDDGSVAYINGTEVHRLRVGPGPLTYATGANAGGAEPHTLEGPFDLPTSSLVYGDNVLAIAVLQSGTASSDIVMGAQLLAKVSACVPPLFISHSGSTATLTWPDPTFSLESAPNITGPWSPMAGASGVMVSTVAGNRFFRLVK